MNSLIIIAIARLKMNLKITLNLKGGLVKNPQRVQQGIWDQLAVNFQVFGNEVKREVRAGTPIGATGMLSKGIDKTVSKYPGGLKLEIFPSELYAPYVESGTKGPRRMPPFEPLVYWVERRLGIKGKEARSVARAIQIKIAREGTPKREMFTKAFNKTEPKLPRLINSTIAFALRKYGV